MDNYRSISVLPSLNKVFERLLAARLKSFLRGVGFFGQSQVGFRPRTNTNAAVTELMNFVYKALDQKNVKLVSCVFVDLKKAFDTVDHLILLNKLYHASMRGIVRDPFSSYLTDRSLDYLVIGVFVNRVESFRRSIDTGVVQGS